MKTKNASIKRKIFLYFIGFSCLMLVLLWLVQTVFLDTFYKQIKLSEVEKVTSQLAGYLEKGEEDTVSSIVAERGDIQVEVLSENGETIAAFGRFREQAPKPSISDPLRQPAYDAIALFEETRQNGGSLTREVARENPPEVGKQMKPKSILCTHILVMQDGVERLLVVSADISPVNATVETLRIQLYYISGVMILLAVFLSLLISKRVSKPIEKLNEAAKDLAKGNYGVSFDGKGYLEIAELSDTLNHAAAELDKTESLRRELIANVSHDLRTPLTLITGYAEMMRDIPGEDTPENMQVIIDEAKRLTSLVKDLMDLSQLQSGTQGMQLGDINLTEETREIINRFSKFSGPEGYTVTFHCGEDIFVHADSKRISQVIYNYLINAMTHAGADKTITVRQKTEKEQVTIEVADTGEGIPSEQISSIWERYYKVDKVHKRPAAGSGLGLSIVKNILDQHPGVKYGVKSVPGQGSTFWFSLPMIR